MKERAKNVGQGMNRIDGLLKVTGAASYATDYALANLAYAVIFKSEIAAGKITEIETSAAEKAVGVLAVITHKNAPKLNEKGGIRGGGERDFQRDRQARQRFADYAGRIALSK
ncbi:MAG: hypothetical protein LH614_22860 [Pyrinomonadaceae bacterium]|nr:hypothetical protein [Pyrinomonadaceae bacterium]